MLESLNAWLVSLAGVLPLEIFVFVGSFAEEIIAPIPSILITTLAGTLAEAADYGYAGLALLVVLATLGKSLGCAVIYVIADKAEDALMTRVGPWMGISHAEVERVGKYFTGSIRDYLILIVIRALPVSPSLPISVVAGILKVPFAFYNIATFIGNLIRSALFIAAGFFGLSAFESLLAGAGSIESLVQIAIAIVLIGIVGAIYLIRHRRGGRVRSEEAE
ncbi:MAG TPA: VTT domain-containing protein [Candidatus Paceibacterota bacterium]|nr:VTT domain-containing protein [Candidatus Paceibacterota bacterium]